MILAKHPKWFDLALTLQMAVFIAQSWYKSMAVEGVLQPSAVYGFRHRVERSLLSELRVRGIDARTQVVFDHSIWGSPERENRMMRLHIVPFPNAASWAIEIDCSDPSKPHGLVSENEVHQVDVFNVRFVEYSWNGEG